MQNKALMTGVLLAALSLGSLLSFGEDKVTLKRAFKDKSVTNYHLSLIADTSGDSSQKVNVTFDLKETVTQVKSDGSATVGTDVSNTHIKMGNDEIPMDAFPGLIETFGPDGNLTDIKINGSGQAGDQLKRFKQFTDFKLPSNAVAVGDKWTGETKASKDTPSLKTNYEVVSMEKVGDADTVKIKIDGSLKDNDGSAAYNGFAWVDKSNGQTAKLSMNLNPSSKDAQGPQKIAFTLERTGAGRPVKTNEGDSKEAKPADTPAPAK